METDSVLVEKAFVLALRAHEGQLRKDAPTPYIAHPVRVALLIARYGFSDTVIAAALVHDVIEDTDIPFEELRRELGDAVADLVATVTHDARLGWDERKKGYIGSVRAASIDAKAIATADKIANAESLIAAYARDGSAVWSAFNAGRDKKLWFESSMLEMLRETWDHPLVEEYARRVEDLERLP